MIDDGNERSTLISLSEFFFNTAQNQFDPSRLSEISTLDTNGKDLGSDKKDHTELKKKDNIDSLFPRGYHTVKVLFTPLF